MKANRIRKFHGPGPRPDRRKQRQLEAVARNSMWEELSPSEQHKALDARLGKGIGATKQRARLAKLRAA